MIISWKERLLASVEEQMTEKHIRIVIAAVELFGEQGYADTSTREIARRAEVSEGTIFKHYATKKELLLDISRLIVNNIILPIFDYGLEELFARPYDKLEDFIRLFINNRLDLIEGNVILVKVLLQEAMFHADIRRYFLQAIQQSRFISGLELLKEQGLLPERPTAELLGLIIPSIFGYILSRYIIMPELFTDNREQDREQFVRFLARGLTGRDVI